MRGARRGRDGRPPRSGVGAPSTWATAEAVRLLLTGSPTGPTPTGWWGASGGVPRRRRRTAKGVATNGTPPHPPPPLPPYLFHTWVGALGGLPRQSRFVAEGRHWRAQCSPPHAPSSGFIHLFPPPPPPPFVPVHRGGSDRPGRSARREGHTVPLGWRGAGGRRRQSSRSQRAEAGAGGARPAGDAPPPARF